MVDFLLLYIRSFLTWGICAAIKWTIPLFLYIFLFFIIDLVHHFSVCKLKGRCVVLEVKFTLNTDNINEGIIQALTYWINKLFSEENKTVWS